MAELYHKIYTPGGLGKIKDDGGSPNIEGVG